MFLKRIVSIFLACIMGLSLFLCLFSCKKEEPTVELNKYSASSFSYFDTVTLITGYEKTKEEFDVVSNEILALLAEYHKLYTIYNRYEGINNLCTVNKTVDEAHAVVEVDSRILDLIEFCKEIYTLTNGQNNIAMGSVLSIWHTYREDGLDDPQNASLPTDEELQAASQHTNIEDIIIDRENSTIFLQDPKMKLDVGSIAKGYAVECIANYLEEKGITGYCLNVGGNVRTIGPRGDNSTWKVGIENPNYGEEPKYLAILGLSDYSLVVSGSYQRYYVVDGVEYNHIIDPDTLYPATYYSSLAIVCKSSAMGDALSTALFCMPYEDALAIIESLPDTEAYFTLVDGTQYASSGFDAFRVQN